MAGNAVKPFHCVCRLLTCNTQDTIAPSVATVYTSLAECCSLGLHLRVCLKLVSHTSSQAILTTQLQKAIKRCRKVCFVYGSA